MFFDRHAPRVHGLARVILGDPVAADDAVQETFLRVWRFASGFDPRRGSVAGWLMSAARNVSVDAARLRGTLQYLDPEILLSLAAAAPVSSPLRPRSPPPRSIASAPRSWRCPSSSAACCSSPVGGACRRRRSQPATTYRWAR